MRKLIHLSGIIAVVLTFHCCNQIKEKVNPSILKKNNESGGGTTTTTSNAACAPVVSNFYAGQHFLAGTITVENDSNNIYVTFATVDGWTMSQTHLYVGPKSGLPAGKSGNPKIGNFPYKESHTPGATSFTYTISRASLGSDSCIVIAAHANVSRPNVDGEGVQEETAWGGGNEITPGGSWATYFDYCICNDTDNDDDDDDGGVING